MVSKLIRIIRNNIRTLDDFFLFFKILGMVIILPILLRVLSIPKLMTVLTPRKLKTNKNLDLEKIQGKIVKFVDYILTRRLWTHKNFCLKRSIVLYHFLRKLGINVDLCLGVRYHKEEAGSDPQKKIEGHAWLFYKGGIFLEKDSQETQSYTTTYCFPDKMKSANNLAAD